MLPTTLECSLDAKHRYDPNELQTTCPVDGAPLLVVYAQPALRTSGGEHFDGVLVDANEF